MINSKVIFKSILGPDDTVKVTSRHEKVKEALWLTFVSEDNLESNSLIRKKKKL